MTTAASTKKSPAPAPAIEPVAPAAPAAVAPTAATPFSITALVLGITGILLGQWLLSVGAIVFGFVSRGRELNGRLIANWGLVLGFAGVFGGLVLGLLGVAAFLPFWFFGSIGDWDLWNF